MISSAKRNTRPLTDHIPLALLSQKYRCAVVPSTERNTRPLTDHIPLALLSQKYRCAVVPSTERNTRPLTNHIPLALLSQKYRCAVVPSTERNARHLTAHIPLAPFLCLRRLPAPGGLQPHIPLQIAPEGLKSFRLFGRGISRRISEGLRSFSLQHPGDVKVDQTHISLRSDHHIVRLDVPVNNGGIL